MTGNANSDTSRITTGATVHSITLIVHRRRVDQARCPQNVQPDGLYKHYGVTHSDKYYNNILIGMFDLS